MRNARTEGPAALRYSLAVPVAWPGNAMTYPL